MPVSRTELESAVSTPLPLPGTGETFGRWASLADTGESDLALAKVVEPHHDARAILAEIDDDAWVDGTWAVWAAQPPFARLTAVEHPDGWRLDGRKAFCSGGRLVTHALVTAETEDGAALFAVELSSNGITVDLEAPGWVGPGMAGADTVTLAFEDVVARPVGAPGAYTDRPGFWHGAIGVAAVWWGGARGVAQVLEASTRLDPHGLAHRGAVRAALDAARAVLIDAAQQVDAHPEAPAERLAQSVRATVASTVDTVLDHVGRATGPGPLAFDAAHAARVADLTVFVRQHHAERDLQRLGELGPTP